MHRQTLALGINVSLLLLLLNLNTSSMGHASKSNTIGSGISFDSRNSGHAQESKLHLPTSTPIPGHNPHEDFIHINAHTGNGGSSGSGGDKIIKNGNVKRSINQEDQIVVSASGGTTSAGGEVLHWIEPGPQITVFFPNGFPPPPTLTGSPGGGPVNVLIPLNQQIISALDSLQNMPPLGSRQNPAAGEDNISQSFDFGNIINGKSNKITIPPPLQNPVTSPPLTLGSGGCVNGTIVTFFVNPSTENFC